MEKQRLEKLLNELADAASEPVSSDLAEKIKQNIPHKPVHHGITRDTANIVINLRVSRLAAAAVILVTLALCANFLGGRDSLSGDGIYQDSKLLIKYGLGGRNAGRSEVLAGLAGFYEYLVHEGKDVAYYGNTVDPEDNDAVLMHWKESDGRYKVIFCDLRTKTVTAEELVTLQSRMLEN